MTGGMMFKDWESPPDSVWVWGKYKKYNEVYCHSEEIKQEEFEIPVTKYVRDDLAKAAPELMEALIGIIDSIGPDGYIPSCGLPKTQAARAAIAKALGEQK